MKQFYFYKIKKEFEIMLKKEMLYVFYDLITRNNQKEFESVQIDNMIDTINREEISKKIIEEFSSSNYFNVNNTGDFTINNNISDDFEILSIKKDHILLESKNNNSKFLKFISLHYPSYVIIDEDNKQISSLRLVNPLQIS